MGNPQSLRKAYSKKAVQKGWLMYDWANSAYFLVITTAIFPLFYTAITTTERNGIESDVVDFLGKTFINTQLYSYIIAASFLIVIVASPLLSGMADYLGRKLFFLKCFCYIGATGCIGLFWFDPQHLEWSMSALFMANIGAWGSLGFYNAFLPEIAEREEQDLLSAKGYSWGFAGCRHTAAHVPWTYHGRGRPPHTLGLRRRRNLVGRMGPSHLPPHARQSQKKSPQATSFSKVFRSCAVWHGTSKAKPASSVTS